MGLLETQGLDVMPSRFLVSDLFRLLRGWRSQLVWRVFGFAVSIGSIGGLSQRLIAADFQFDMTRFAITVLGLLLLLTGPRLITLILFSICSVLHVYQLVFSPLSFPGVEWPLIVSLPTTMAFSGLYLVIFRKPVLDVEREFEKTTISLFRFTGLIVSAFVVIHKINADFFNASVSCANLYVDRLQKLLSIGDWIEFLNPSIAVIILEGLIPLLLIIFPIFGILFGTLFLSIFYIFQIFNINLLVITLSLSFFRHTDKELFKFSAKNFLIIILFSILGIMIYARLALPTYAWVAAFPCIVLSACISVLVSKFLITKFFQERVTNINFFCHEFALDLRSDYPDDIISKIIVILFILLMLLNSISPYLGFKFHYSFSMFSNLRADQKNWNSYLFPQWFNLLPEPDFVKIHDIQYESDPADFFHALNCYIEERFVNQKPNITIDIDFKGNHYKFGNIINNQDYRFFLNDNHFIKKPKKTNCSVTNYQNTESEKLFIKKVTIDGNIINPFFYDLFPSIISLPHFAESMKKFSGNQQTKRRVHLIFDYQGKMYNIVDAGRDPAFRAWLNKRHDGTSLFQKVRDLHSPQRCIH